MSTERLDIWKISVYYGRKFKNGFGSFHYKLKRRKK